MHRDTGPADGRQFRLPWTHIIDMRLTLRVKHVRSHDVLYALQPCLRLFRRGEALVPHTGHTIHLVGADISGSTMFE